jgi:hypothetical protein
MKAVAAESEPQPKSATAAGETASPDQAAPAQKAPASEAERRVASADQTTAAKAQPAEPETVAPKPAAEPTAAQEAESAALVRRHATERPDGTRYAHPDDVLAIMRDTTMVRALKKAPEDVQLAFSNTRESIYRQHDATVEQHVKDTVPGMKDRIVRVLEFRTPGETGFSLNTDRDYRVCCYAGFDAHGDPQWIEVPRQHWEAKSYETFAKLTGGPTDSPEASKEWAAELQQLATDKYHPEASPAFSDQKTIWNPLIRKFEKIQVTANFTEVSRYPGLDPKSAGTLPKLEDPQALGHMYEMKVGDARQTPEKYVQANKAVEAFVAVRKSYNVQGRQIGVVSDKVLAGMDAVAKVARQLKADPNCRDPIAVAEGEKTLRDLGFQDMKDFMNKLSSQFESLKTMSAPPPARPNPGKS